MHNKDLHNEKILKSIKSRQIIIPILLGFAVVIFMFWKEFNAESFSSITFTKYGIIWIIVAALMMVSRDIGYIIRLKILSGTRLTWKQCIRIIFLWEFTSAVTPSAVGGTSVAVFFLYKEKISLGESSAIVMATAFLDELYFLIMFPFLLLIVNQTSIFSIGGAELASADSINWINKFFYFSIIGYSLKAIFTMALAYGLFINPRGLKYFLACIFKFRLLKRWRKAAIKTGVDIMHASKEFKSKPFSFWLKTFGTTFIAWTSRYWVVNFLFLAFFVVPDHVIIFARQLVMWIMMLISPTPGGSGFAEFIFSEFLGEYIPIVTLIPILVILWRLITYYPYLIVGAFLVPIWIKMKFTTKVK